MAAGRGRGGTRRWREWLRRATHHSADDDRQLVQAAEQSRRDGEVEPDGSIASSGTRTQASLDQVLRRAAEAQAAQRDKQS